MHWRFSPNLEIQKEIEMDLQRMKAIQTARESTENRPIPSEHVIKAERRVVRAIPPLPGLWGYTTPMEIKYVIQTWLKTEPWSESKCDQVIDWLQSMAVEDLSVVRYVLRRIHHLPHADVILQQVQSCVSRLLNGAQLKV